MADDKPKYDTTRAVEILKGIRKQFGDWKKWGTRPALPPSLFSDLPKTDPSRNVSETPMSLDEHIAELKRGWPPPSLPSSILVSPPDPPCTHGVTFDAQKADRLSEHEVRKLWPRGWFTQEKPCPDCGYVGIAYASYSHYIAGDW